MQTKGFSRRTFLRGVGASGALIRIGLPPLEAMFNSSGTAYAAPGKVAAKNIESRFIFWFNGNGIPEKYWIPREDGPDYEMTPCLTAAGAVSQRHSCYHRPRQPCGAIAGSGQQPPPRR